MTDRETLIKAAKGVPLQILIRMIPKTRIVSGCWEWQGAVSDPKDKNNQYGVIKVGSRTDKSQRKERVHRISYEIFKGTISPGLLVCHTCDNPRCWNPDHLFLGTFQDNSDDKMAKGRDFDMSGEWNPNAKLCWDDVRSIRQLHSRGISNVDLSKQFNISKAVISDIVLGKKWKEVAESAELEEGTAHVERQGWTSVGERLPDSHGMYLTICFGGGKWLVDTTLFDHLGWHCEHHRLIEAWMPIPEYKPDA